MTVIVLPFRSAGFWMPESAHHELHKSLAAEQRDDLHGDTVLPDHDGRVRNNAAERHVAGADFLGHIDATAADCVIHIKAGLREIAFALGDLDRAESRQNRRRREQIGDLLVSAGRRDTVQSRDTKRDRGCRPQRAVDIKSVRTNEHVGSLCLERPHGAAAQPCLSRSSNFSV